MSTSIPALLINSHYFSRSYSRKGAHGVIVDVSKRDDCWRTCANDEQAYHVTVRPPFVLGDMPKPDFHATIYVNTSY